MFFANEQFRQLFGFTSVRHISAVESYHCFARLEFQKQMCDQAARSKLFRYEHLWQTHVDYDKLVLDSWQKGVGREGL